MLTSRGNLRVEQVPLQPAAYCQLCLAELFWAERNGSCEQSPAGHAGTIAIILGRDPKTSSQMHRCSALTLGAQVCYLNGLTVSMEKVESPVQNVLGNDALGLQRF